jgi:hypothetical protein
MKTICSFCNITIHDDRAAPDLVTHGVCPSCYQQIMRTYGFNIRKFLDMLDAPVFLVDDDVNILAANARAIAIVNKPLPKIQGHICGMVLECINAFLPDGCGKTPQCPDCIIRSTVSETYKTSHAVDRRHASFTRKNGDSPEKVDLLVSTKKDGNVVLLRLEPVGATPV